MDFHDAISARLPEPRDDEPAGLRQDIVDELADHLACAYRRELLRGASSTAARAPSSSDSAIRRSSARRLWLDHMKGKIMTQRILIATCLVVMAACITAVGLSWHWMTHDKLLRSQMASEVMEANRRMSAALAESQAANQEMLKQMREMSQATLHPVSVEWNPVTFKLTEETADGPPTAGFSLTLTSLERYPTMGGQGGFGGAGAAVKNIRRISDASGAVNFGSVQPGDYQFGVAKNWDTGYYRTQGQLNVAPGSKVEKSIICPKAPPERATVRVRCAWPADLAREQLVLRVPFSFRYRKLESSLEWFLVDTATQERPTRRRNLAAADWGTPAAFGGPMQRTIRAILYGPNDHVFEIARFRNVFNWRQNEAKGNEPEEEAAPQGRGQRAARNGPNRGGAVTAIRQLAPGDWADIATADLRVITPAGTPEPHELQFELGVYGIDSLMVLRPTRSGPLELDRKRFDILAAGFANSGPLAIDVRATPPDLQTTQRRGPGMTGAEMMDDWGARRGARVGW